MLYEVITSMLSARGHTPDIDPLIERVLLHPDAVPEQRAACHGTADVDSYNFV